MAKRKPEDDLDTETTFANMNVEGFRWYDPHKKPKNEKTKKQKVSKKEYRAMVKGAFLAMFPFIVGAVIIMGILFLLCWVWLGS